jgi:excisionase family DNA binding protein
MANRIQASRMTWDEAEKMLHVNVKQASDIIGCGTKLIYKLIDLGEIPAAKIGISYRIPVQALKNYIEQKAAENLR